MVLDAIQKFFERNLAAPATKSGQEHRLRVATAALLIEMTRMDQNIKDVERDRVMHAIRTKFDLTEAETAELLRLAEVEAKDATDYYQFTSLINRGFTPEQKVRVIEHLWRVAYADGHLDRYEEHLVRKIADLLYVPHATFIAAKHRARDAG